MPTALRRVASTLAAICLALAALIATTAERAAALDPFTGYLLAHFTGDTGNGEQIYFAHSSDGMRWTDLNGGAPVLLSTVGTRGVRDPALVRSPTGDKYWIIATDLRIASGTVWSDATERGSTALVVWESTDLVTWSAPRLMDVAKDIPGAGDAWAPEAIHDPSTGDYLVYWATNATLNGVRHHRVYSVRTRDFRTFTTPQLYIDRPQGIIDTQIIEVPGSVGGHRYYRASADGQITVEGSNSLLGTWTRIGDLSHLGISNGATGGNVVEGPMWQKLNGRTEWNLWVDQYASKRGYMPLTSTDLGSTRNFRTRSSSEYSMGTSTKRHGSVLNLTAAEEARVLARWGTARPAIRLQSHNYPDRYVRHLDFDVRLDAGVSPLQDSQFRLVPGLAGASGTVSLESVNFPGHYLRHYGFDLVLARDDGTSVFGSDATFTEVPGLADGSAASFRSYNYPDRYLRHFGFELRLDTVSTSVARADATFRVVR
ncbi:alpha-L-arabinofuranosidase B-like protein [Kineococcus xinjiangensis]|uniref:Alpha-L-arabinofuranosidase B-like protein n=1 Tax=Kineococcus xinjiangensis TaxID=512762 RepID=A0A2S6IK77_9ACTN|nr:glycoside hydrolase family 43 protein [Kineococcus xinjiangensis]PPK94560.1 alpha-L-arabinofuranosidase B-like protein [Kineococcus xinjiangensis]